MKTIYLVRHGQTAYNKARMFQGHTNVPLNEEGLAAAQILKKRLQDIPLAKIYVTDLVRTRQTAEPTARDHQITIEEVPALKEICFGEWEGLTFEEINARWPAEFKAVFNHPSQAKVVGGEGFFEVQKRAWQAFQQLVEKQGEDTSILVVSHGGAIRMVLCALLEIPIDNMWKITLDNVSVTKIYKDKNRLGLVYLNNVDGTI